MKKFYIFCSILGLLFLSGCGTPRQYVRGDKCCQDYAHDVFERAKDTYPVRYATGIVPSDFKGRHMWVEYFYKGKWRVWDEAIWWVGKSFYTAKELGYFADGYYDGNHKRIFE
jgi:hypothetical protein